MDPDLQIHPSDGEDLYDPLLDPFKEAGITDAQPAGTQRVNQDNLKDALYTSEVIHLNNRQFAPLPVPPEQAPKKVRSEQDPNKVSSPKKDHRSKANGPSKEKLNGNAIEGNMHGLEMQNIMNAEIKGLMVH